MDNLRHDGGLFEARKPYRQIVVMVDADLLVPTGTNAVPSNSEVLSSLLLHPLVALYRYADDGPPADVAPNPDVPYATDRFPVYDGWVKVSDHDTKRGWGVVFSHEPGSWSSSGVWGNAVEVAEHDAATSAYQDVGPTEAAQRRRADGLAVQVAAQALHADFYVTERPYVHEATWMQRDVTVVSIDSALALLGLYFRMQGEFPIAHRFSFNRGLFYWVGARELLSAAWRWHAACVHESLASNDDTLMLLGGSLLQRFERALQARDAVHLALNQPQDNDTQDEALAQLDVALFSLMGCVDIAARVAHHVLGLRPAEAYRAGWQKRGKGNWLEQVRAKKPALAQVVDASTPGDHAITILRLLRNSVHGAALQGIAYVRAGEPQQSLVALPADDEVALLAAVDALGGRAFWGIREFGIGRVHLEPGVFIDSLFQEIADLLNELMVETPVEWMPNAALKPEDCAPPDDSGKGGIGGSFDPPIRASIRAQLGFS